MDIIKFFENENKTLALEVVSTLGGGEIANATIPLWKTLEKVGTLAGAYRLIVKSKTTGASGFTNRIKVVGLGQVGGYPAVMVKVQSSASNCYNGLLTKQKDDPEAITGSVLQEALRKVTSHSWYDPDHPMNREEDSVSEAPERLQSVSPILEAAISRPATLIQKEERTVKGIIKDSAAEKDIFTMMAETAQSGIIESKTVSRLIVEWAYGVGSEKTPKCAGPVIKSWIKKGWLIKSALVQKSYTICPVAVTTFGLKLNQAPPTQSPKAILPASIPTASPSKERNRLESIQYLRAQVTEIKKAEDLLEDIKDQTETLKQEIEGLKQRIDALSAKRQEIKAYLGSPEVSDIREYLKAAKSIEL
jgi:hypothetical protein